MSVHHRANKYFYYSEEDCKYVAVNRSYRTLIGKAALTVGLSVAATIFLMKLFGGHLVMTSENERLQTEVAQLTEKLGRINTAMTTLAESDSLLRTAVNLPVPSAEERAMSTGGRRQSLAADASGALLSVSNNLIDKLSMQVSEQQKSYETIMAKYELNKRFFASLPAIKPVEGTRTSGFGTRMHPIYGVLKFHSGQDFQAAIGTDVYATGDGVIETAESESGYGNVVVVNHGFGYKTAYAHLSKFLVKTGQTVKRGERIALSGNTGVSDGPHVHYEVMKDGIKLNPDGFMFNDMTPVALSKAASETAVATNATKEIKEVKEVK
ncbi:MAG: M23 family metallopeptidase [Rhizobacter sp.]|nr:M23 family metallopeptidase [Chlorobiales bacterium]